MRRSFEWTGRGRILLKLELAAPSAMAALKGEEIPRLCRGIFTRVLTRPSEGSAFGFA
jgi:hypothetical protein